jgi:hypothetical protein
MPIPSAQLIERLRRQSLYAVKRYTPAMEDEELVDQWIHEFHCLRGHTLCTYEAAQKVGASIKTLMPMLQLFATTVCPDEWAAFRAQLQILLNEIVAQEQYYQAGRPACYPGAENAPVRLFTEEFDR